MKNKTPILGELPGFITPDVLKKIEDLVTELKRLDDQIFSLRPSFAEKARDRAREDYVTDPSEKNFARLKAASLEIEIVEKLLPSSMQAIVQHVRTEFVNKNIVPFVTEILNDGLTRAKATLENITSEEQDRHLQLTGQGLAGDNAIIAAARRPVTEIERLLRTDSRGGAESDFPVALVFEYLRSHVASAAAN